MARFRESAGGKALALASAWFLLASLPVESGRFVRRAAAEVPALSLRLDCPTRAGKGRIVCTLDVEARDGRVMRWADALVVYSPDFAPPLRTRVLATLPEEGATRVTIPIALFARGENTGTLRVKSRAVVCKESNGDDCAPESREIEASVAVTREPRSSAEK